MHKAFKECRLPNVWKLADVSPLLKSSSISDFNKDLHPISLTSTLSKVEESIVIEQELNPAFFKVIDVNQYLFQALQLINLTSAVRAVFLDFRKAFDLIDHTLLIAKIYLAWE